MSINKTFKLKIFVFLVMNSALLLMIGNNNIHAMEGATDIHYELTITEPASHLLDVEIKINNLQSALLEAGLLVIGVHDSVNMDQQLTGCTASNSQTGEIFEIRNAHDNGAKKTYLLEKQMKFRFDIRYLRNLN